MYCNKRLICFKMHEQCLENEACLINVLSPQIHLNSPTWRVTKLSCWHTWTSLGNLIEKQSFKILTTWRSSMSLQSPQTGRNRFSIWAMIRITMDSKIRISLCGWEPQRFRHSANLIGRLCLRTNLPMDYQRVNTISRSNTVSFFVFTDVITRPLSDMVWCYSGLKRFEHSLKSLWPNISTLQTRY